MAQVSQPVVALAMEALNLGFGCIGDGDHAPFVLIADKAGKQTLVDLKSTTGL